MKNENIKKLLALILALVVIVGLVFVIKSTRKPTVRQDLLEKSVLTAPDLQADTTSISYTDSGFEPTTISVKVGDKVTFTNNSNSPLWVASNPHPIHTDYSAFDEKTSVTKGQSWTFTFTKSGKFGYHNHLGASDTGSVEVK